jgi:hypothetical protein
MSLLVARTHDAAIRGALLRAKLFRLGLCQNEPVNWEATHTGQLAGGQARRLARDDKRCGSLPLGDTRTH